MTDQNFILNHRVIAVIGLGYVGLPLAVAFGNFRKVIGFDINKKRISDLVEGVDVTMECSKSELQAAKHLTYTANKSDLRAASIYIVTVPTPIGQSKSPDLTLLINATMQVAEVLKKNDVVIFESTVFPGATEEVCVPVLEEGSGLKFNLDFFCGYSPERINPGDREHTLSTVVKVTSGSTKIVADAIDDLYGQIVSAGTFKAESIQIAEAAKVIENTQRDLNIALMNELSVILKNLDWIPIMF